MIIIKVFYIILYDLVMNCLFENILNVIINKFNELFFHFLFFENIIL